MRPHLDYGDVISDKAYNNSFQQRLESLQFEASVAATGANTDSSTERLFNRRLLRKLCVSYQIVLELSQKYLLDLIPSNNNSY